MLIRNLDQCAIDLLQAERPRFYTYKPYREAIAVDALLHNRGQAK